MQVTARMTAQDIYDSDADVLVRVIPEGYSDGVIYIAYNNTDGTDYCSKYNCLLKSVILYLHACMYHVLSLAVPGTCTHIAQRYTPLLAEHIESDSSEHVDGTLVTVQWREQDHSDGYIVAVGDYKGQCTSQRPCLIIKNTVCL